MSLNTVLKYVHMDKSISDVQENKCKSTQRGKSWVWAFKREQYQQGCVRTLSLLKLYIIVENMELTVCLWVEVNRFPSAHICRTELTSPAVKSLMTLQCCGPHSARPASPNQCLLSNSQHARRQVRRFRSCATKQPLQTSITNVHSGRHRDSQALRSVGIYLCPPGPGPALHTCILC